MKYVKTFEALTSYRDPDTINRIRKVYSEFMKQFHPDQSNEEDPSNDFDIIWKSNIDNEQYKQFIKELEKEFKMQILVGIWYNDKRTNKYINSPMKSDDRPDDKYRTFNGLESYINGKS